jgi:hypothetical protein
MKHSLLIISFLTLSRLLFAPGSGAVVVGEAEVVNPYQRIIEAVGWVESRHDTFAVNRVEQAYGYFQVRQVRLKDYYRLTGVRYSLQDMFDYDKAERVFMYYARTIGWREPEVIARSWNGGDCGMKLRDTVKYWKQVKAQL